MLVLSSGLLATLPLAACSSTWAKNYREVRTLQIPHIAGTALGVENANGAVEVLSRDREDISIEVTLYGPDLERLHFANVNAIRQGDESLRVWVDWPGGKREKNEGAAISINTPGAENVHIRTTNGRVITQGLGGRADIQTTNGSIRVDTHDGEVHTSSTNGNFDAEHVSGEIEAFTSNGRINIIDAFGPIRAESTNGSAFISTTHGNSGPIRVRTTNGNVTLDLGEGFEGVLKCDTSNGKIQVINLESSRLIESSSRRVELKIGQSSEVSAVRTSNGSVRVRGR